MQLSPAACDCRLISMTCSVVISRNPHLCECSQGHLAPFAPLDRLREKQKLISVQRTLHVNGLEWPCIQMPSRRRLRHRNSKLAQGGCGWCVYCFIQRMGHYLQPLEAYDCQHQASLERTDIENVLLAWLIKKLCFSISSYILSYLDAVYFNLTFCSGQY